MRGCWWVAAPALLWAAAASGAEPWRFEIVDASGEPTAARVSLTRPGGDGVFPEGVNRYLGRADVPYFYTDGRFEVTATGPLRVVVTKGFEHEVVRREVERGEAPTRLRMERGFHMAQRGWYSGDGHVHPFSDLATYPLSNADLLRQMKAEDLNVVNLLALNRRSDVVHGAERVTGKIEPESERDRVLRFSEEFRSQPYGHLAVYGLKKLSDPVHTGFPGTRTPFDFPTNHDAALRYGEQGAFASFAHLVGLEVRRGREGSKNIRVPEVPVDVALGSLDSVEVMGFGVLPGLALPVWERFMDAGYDVRITAGTDSFLGRVRQTRMGGARAYVQMDGRPFTYESWADQLRVGRAFLTNGAMLFLRVGGVRPGESIELEPGETRVVPVELEVLSLFPWRTLEVRQMGRPPLRFRSAPDDTRQQRFRGELSLDRPSWVYARLDGDWSQDIPTGGLGKGRPPHLAVTNAVWIRRGDERRDDPDDVDYFVKWVEGDMERLELRDNYGSPENRKHVRGVFQRALDVLRQRFEKASKP